jgi:hypothetical protein
LVFDSYNAAFFVGELSYLQRQAVITLLHKGKELPRDELGSWRPISLTNTDYKLLAKSMARQLSEILTNIMHENQVGFVNPFTASCENAMNLSVPGVPAYCEKFPHSSQLNF